VKESKKTGSALGELLAALKATCQGEGDINAGTNSLVARAVILSSLSRTGCGIDPPRLSRMKAGCSLLVSGGHSSSLVSEVVTEVAIRQNNLTAQFERLIRDKVEDGLKKGQKNMEFPSGPSSNVAENALFHLEQKDPLIPLDSQEEWTKVLNFPPNPRIDDLAARPKVLVTAKGPRDLEKQLHRLHGNRPFVALSLNGTAEASAYADTCDALLNGPYPVGEFGETVEANLLVTDPGNVLARITPKAGDKEAWLGRMVWLVEGTLGPDAVENVHEPDTFHVSDTGGRFGEALTAVLAKRLNNHDAGTVVHPFDLIQVQIRWIAYLKGMEGRLPGITGTARGLLATLAFGLIELAKAPNFKPLPVTPEGVEALGRWVIERMANARTMMIHAEGLAQRRSQIERVFGKLEQGPTEARSIYRNLNGINAWVCHECLRWMEETGISRRIGDRWELVEGARLNFNN